MSRWICTILERLLCVTVDLCHLGKAGRVMMDLCHFEKVGACHSGSFGKAGACHGGYVPFWEGRCVHYAQ